MDVSTYWKIVGSRPVPVPVVAACDWEGPAGFLALSVTHVSPDPPTMMVCIGMNTSALPTIERAGVFSINYLPEADWETAEVFGGRRGVVGADRFANGDWAFPEHGAPVFSRAVATVTCAVDQVFPCQQTRLVVGRIVQHALNHGRAPLL